MNVWRTILRPPWRTIVPGAVFLTIFLSAFFFWSPGKDVTDGSHDRGRNGIWLQHGWIGDDEWYVRAEREDRKPFFRDIGNVRELASLLRQHRITDVFPHLCPCRPSGEISKTDPKQTEAFLDVFKGFRVMPWIGGAKDMHAYPEDAKWRSNFVASASALLRKHPRLAGIHLNIEPCPSGDEGFLTLLEELKKGLPDGKILSVAAYPPPTRWHPYPDVHWDEEYFRKVAARVDQIVPMLYDTGLRRSQFYQQLMSNWTREVLDWSEGRSVLLGLPTYDDAGVGYHDPRVENLENGLLGIHAGLAGYDLPPENYQGVALYCEWEMDDAEWKYFARHFRAPVAHQAPVERGESQPSRNASTQSGKSSE